ncbi:MAG: archaemetzincin family Zn-dependent metalloprotease [bacterium]
MVAVDLVRVGDVGDDVFGFLSDGLARELRAEVTSSGAAAIPSEAYDPLRGQYRSREVLAALRHPETARGQSILLAVTPVDLFAPELNFVFGEAHPAERKCLISLARLGRPREGGPAGTDLLRERALTEAIHEIGHVLGLGHCGRRDCAMFFSNTLADTDRKGHKFCPDCRRALEPGEGRGLMRRRMGF